LAFDPSILISDARRDLMPPDSRPIYEWARDAVSLPLGGYAIPGRFDVSRSRHLVDVLDAVRSPRIRTVNILKATQSGGTLAADVSVAWLLANDPGPSMWNFPDEPLARQHAKTRLMPLLKGSPALRHLLPDNRHDNTSMEILFTNGVPFVIQAATVGRLQGRSIRYMINDECWEWDDGNMREADARLAAYRRFQMEKVINISQAGDAGTEWERVCFDPSTEFREWRVPCRGCGTYRAITLEIPTAGEPIRTILWDDDGKNIRWRCPDCGREERDTPELKAFYNEAGKYVADKMLTDAQAITFKWNAFAWHGWEGLASQYREAVDAKAMGNLTLLRKFIQKHLVDFWREETMLPVIMPATYDAQEGPGKLEGSATRFLTLDTQHDHLWACVREWKQGGASRLLHWSRLETFDDADKLAERYEIPRANWPAVLKWQNSHPRPTKPPQTTTGVIIDTGGNRTQEVYDACWRFGWIGTKGTAREDYTHRVTTGSRTFEYPALYQQTDAILNYESKGACLPLLIVATNGCKNILANLRDGKGARWEVPSGIPKDYVAWLNSESKFNVGGKWVWKKIGSRENHSWDCEALQVLAASMRGVFKLS
jgi:hypothetical protein